MTSKLMTAERAVSLIKDGDTIAVEGAGRLLLPEAILSALEVRFLKTDKPRGLTVIHPTGLGDDKDAGMNHFGHEGLVRRVIGGAWGDAPKMGKLAVGNKLEAYCFPQGVICQMIEASAAKKPRVISHVGLGTFVDPRQQGGKLNKAAKDELVEIIKIDDEEYLYYRVLPINIAILRGTTADELGNISMEEEPIILLSLTMAQAAKNAGGLVLVEVKRIARGGSLNPQLVRIPGINVDAVVVNTEASQVLGEETYNPAYSGWLKAPVSTYEKIDLDERMVVARRAAMELFPNAVINIGFGIADGIPIVAAQEGIADEITLTVEQGSIGGLPSRGRALAAQLNPQAIISQIDQFNFYQGGGLDLAFLSFAQIDKGGNVNVSKFGSRIIGSGGFIDISQNAKHMVFCGTFAGPGNFRIENDKPLITGKGKYSKFVENVEHITFNGKRAAASGQDVLYVTERAVFGLTADGLILREIAPGIDLQRDILECMDFRPIIARDMKTMDEKIYKPVMLNIREMWRKESELKHPRGM
jgi:propionate CoA-transferase